MLVSVQACSSKRLGAWNIDVELLFCAAKELKVVDGHVSLRDVTFSYPQRRAVLVLKSFNLEAPAGRTLALVGPSGNGKSTIVSLIERFYDPLSGQVHLQLIMALHGSSFPRSHQTGSYGSSRPALVPAPIGSSLPGHVGKAFFFHSEVNVLVCSFEIRGTRRKLQCALILHR